MKIYFLKYKNIFLWLILFLVVGIVQWNLGFTGNKAMVGETDAFSRLSIIQDYVKNGGNVLSPFVNLPLGGVWLSGYFSVFILLSKFGIGEFGFRIFTWFCGLLLTLILWLIVKKLTKRDINFWQMLILFAFIMSPLMLQINLEMLSEPIASFFLLLSLYFLLSEKNKWSMFFLVLSQTVRYESWFVVPFFWIYIGFFIKDRSWKNKIIMFLVTLLFPLIWIVLNFIQSGNPWYFYTVRQSNLDLLPVVLYSNFWMALNEWTLRLQQYVGVEWFLFWFFGTIMSVIFGTNKQKWWAWLSFYSFFIVVLQLWLGSTEWFAPRFIYLVYVLSVPIVLITVNIIKIIYIKINFGCKIIILLLMLWLGNQYILGISRVEDNVNAYFIPNQEVKQITDDLKSEIFVKDNSKKVIYLWIEASPWLVCDFNYYLINVKGWEKIEKIKESKDLAIMKKGDLVVADKGLIEGKKFSKITGNYLFEVWLKGNE